MPRAGLPSDDLPKGIVRGRAVLAADAARRQLPGLRVTSCGMRRAESTDPDGNFQTYLPVGIGWLKISGQVDGRPVIAWRFAAASDGRITDLKDVAVSFGVEDLPAAPAWCDEGRQLLYVVRPEAADPKSGAPRATLRRIKTDGTGDETVASFSASSIIAGPVVRGESAWVKMSDGSILRLDLKSKAISESRSAGMSAPDVLAVSPDGRTIATLAMDATGARSLVLDRKDSADMPVTFKPGEPVPHAIDFSPDGARLVMDLHDADGKSSLWILTLATKQLTRLADNGSSPVWHGR
jgi:hypothetical protein